ncbi:hypothetical protein VTN02DRAFT_3649 [Thermoascus thermophilus]
MKHGSLKPAVLVYRKLWPAWLLSANQTAILKQARSPVTIKMMRCASHPPSTIVHAACLDRSMDPSAAETHHPWIPDQNGSPFFRGHVPWDLDH